jgi:hypothetical protein
MVWKNLSLHIPSGLIISLFTSNISLTNLLVEHTVILIELIELTNYMLIHLLMY